MRFMSPGAEVFEDYAEGIAMNQREDVAQFENLLSNFDVNGLSYAEVMGVFIDFLISLLDSSGNPISLRDDVTQTANDLLKVSKKNLQQSLNSKELEEWRVKAWKLHDAEKNGSAERAIFRAVVRCFYDDGSGSDEEFDNEDLFELFFSICLDIGPGIPSRFWDFCKKRLKISGS